MKSNIVKKSGIAVILCLVLLFSVRIMPCQTIKASHEITSVGQDIQLCQIVFDWLKTQYDPTLKAEDKIKATVNTYFILKYESWKNGRFVDFAYLFNRTDNISWSSYAYERDLLSICLLNWEYYNSLLRSYDYKPELSGLVVENDHAFIRV